MVIDPSALFSIRLSLQVALLSTIFVTLIGGIIAYFLATRNFYGKELIEVAITLPMVMPPTVTGYYLLVLLGRNGIIGGHIYEMTGWTIMFSWQAAVLASFIVSLPLMFKISKAAIASVDKEMVDSAYMLGYSELEAGVKIVLPLAKKGIFAGVILSFARAIGEFGATLMIAGNITDRTNTMPLAIYGYVSGGEWGKANTLVFILTLISGLFLYLANRFSREVY